MGSCLSCAYRRRDKYLIFGVVFDYCSNFEILIETALKEYAPSFECYKEAQQGE